MPSPRSSRHAVLPRRRRHAGSRRGTPRVLTTILLVLAASAGTVIIAYGLGGVRLPVTARQLLAGTTAASAAPTPARTDGSALPTRLAYALNAAPRAEAIRVSVAATNRTTGVSETFQPTQTFQSASIVKAAVLATLLLRAQDTKRSLTTAERTLARSMICYSDNDATDTLWQSVGGATAITTAIRRMGLTATVPNRQAWGETIITAADELRLLQVLLEGGGPLNATSTAQARALMGAVAADQDWGVSAAANSGENVYLKNGWVTNDADDLWIVHSIGEITTSSGVIAIVVLSDGHTSLQDGIDFVEDIAKLTRGCLDA